MYDYDLICLGSGPAGEKAATQAAYYRKRVALVEVRPKPGGAMVNTGTVPSKSLRETALIYSQYQRRPLPGQALSVDRNLSVARLMAYRHLIEQQEHDRIESSIDRHHIDVHVGRGKLLDANSVEVTAKDGSTHTISGKHILIATGSSPLQPPEIPFDHPAVVDADGVLELQRLPGSMIIAGAGVIGCEYASIFAEIDVPTTVIHPRDEILPYIDAECREHLVESMRANGVDFRLNCTVKSVTPIDDHTLRITLSNDEELMTETLLWAAGRQSNSSNLGLEEVGVELGKRGLVQVDSSYRTNIPSIYAAGDVIGFPALASTSMEQGRIAACSMFGMSFKNKLSEVMPIGIYTIPAVSSVGINEAEAIEAGHDIVCGTALYRNNTRGRMLGDEQGILKCVFDRHSRRLLGTTIVGEQATELIHLAESVLQTDQGIDYFINACFNYPSLTELYKYATYDALQSLAQCDQELGRSAKVA